MTRKHFEAIAATIKETKLSSMDRVVFSNRMADTLAAANPLFKRALFLKACGVDVAKTTIKRATSFLHDNNKVDGTLCFFRHTQGNNAGELVSVAVDIEKEEDRKQFIPLFQRLLEYPAFVRAMEEKGCRT